MARAMEGLSTRQQTVLTLLPLFFSMSIIRCCRVMFRVARRPGYRISNLTPTPSPKPSA